MSKLRAHSVLAKKAINTKTIVVAIVCLCILAGAFGIIRSSLIDWDEGVFVLQAQWFASAGASGKPFNFQTPPLFQLVIAIIFLCTGVHGYVLPCISLISSCITLYLLYRIGRLLFSEQESLYAVVLFAVSEFFLFFSRSGLSDSLFLCFFLAAILLFIKGLINRRRLLFLGAGVLLSAACYTKYSAFPLIFSFFLIGLFWKGQKKAKDYLITVLLPIVLFIPYVAVFIKIVQLGEITARHAPLLGFSHIKYLHYLLIYAPLLLFLTGMALVFYLPPKKMWPLLLIGGIYFLFAGFYHPFFRLIYPVVPLLALVASSVIARTGRFRSYVLALLIIVSLLIGYPTLSYHSTIPQDIAVEVEEETSRHNALFIYTITPPNVTFYIAQDILVPSTHPWAELQDIFPPLLSKKSIMYPDSNMIAPGSQIVFLHANIFDSLKNTPGSVYSRTTLVSEFKFIDAPVYVKDPYNPLKNFDQMYELYSVDISSNESLADDIWRLGFEPNVTVMRITE